MPKLSVVALCYREGYTARDFAKRLEGVLKKATLDYEIILVSNYLPNALDITPRLVNELAKKSKRIKAVTRPKAKGQGFGWDVRAGLEAATGELIAFVDGDNQIPPEDVLTVYKKLKKEKLDLAKATRTKRYDGFMRKIISMGYNGIFRLLFPGISDRDIDGKPKIFTRKAYEQLHLKSNDWFLDAEIMIKAQSLGLKYGSVPTVFRKRPRGASSLTVQNCFATLKNLLIYRIKTLRKKLLHNP